MLPLMLGAAPGVDRLVGYHRFRERTLPLALSGLAPAFERAFKDSGAQVVHAMGGEAQAHAALRAARRLGLPFVVTPFAHPGHWGDDDLNLRLYRAADAVCPLLAGEGRWLEANGVDGAKIHVIGVPAADPPPGVERAPDGPPLVLCLGVKRRYKYALLLEALPLVGRPDVRFAFVGPETPDWPADTRGLDDARVLDVPKVDELRKWGWLEGCALLVLPSVSEIMPVSILEAWRMGRPVVVAEGRWTSDLVEDGRDGIIVPPRAEALAEAIEAVLADPARGRAMGEAGRRKVEERYAAAAVSAAHERLYEGLAGAKER